jgi:Putative transposase/Transposase zinc-binding domain
VIPLAEVLRRHWPAYEQKYRARLLPSHRRAVSAVLSCRTPALGGQLFRCECGQQRYVYHSCNHRACPKCGHADATEWLNRQRQRLLPVPYYLVTFTVPAPLRKIIRANQKLLYPLLLRESAAALRDIGRDHKDLGAQLGLLAVLQTWTRDLRYHPHVHCVVPAGGLSADGLRWVSPRREGYFLPEPALALRFRTRLKWALQQLAPTLFLLIDAAAWSLDWVADVEPVGTGQPALKYLAAYVYRTAFSAERIIRDDGRSITFTYKDQDRRQLTAQLSPERFLHRFLQHVLPRGLQRVRYFGFLSAAAKAQWQRVLALLDWRPPLTPSPAPSPLVPLCFRCNKPMALIGLLPRAPPR